MAKNEFDKMAALVIDDVHSMRQLIMRLLQQIGFTKVIVAEDGGEGMVQMETASQPFDIVICDLEMPIINGLEFVRMVRTSTNIANPSVPILIVTGHSEERNIHGAVEQGIQGFIVKPVSLQTLEDQIRRALNSPAIDPETLK